MDIKIKYALWKAYNQRCAYTGQLIENFDDLEIEHIIPKRLAGTNTLNIKKIAYGLEPTFDVKTSLENLLPCFKRANRMKGGTTFSEVNERYYLNIAQEKKNSVQREIQKFISEQEKMKLSLLKESIGEIFTKIRSIIDREHVFMTNSYWNSDSSVAINAFLPSIYDEIGSCVIEFKHTKSMITLKHHEIMQLAEYKKNNVIGKRIDNDKYFLQIGSNTFFLPVNIFNQFTIVFDDFLNEYLKHYQSFEQFIEACDFDRKEESKYYILASLDQSSWKKLLEYSKIYDLDKGETDDYCFNYYSNQIVAMNKSLNNIKFQLRPGKISSNSVDSFINNTLKLDILWEIPSTYDRIRIKDGQVWTVKKTYDWMMRVINL